MSLKVLEFKNKPYPEAEVNESALDIAEALVERIKTAEVKNIFVVCVNSDGNVMNAWSESEQGKPFTMLGAIYNAINSYERQEIE